MPPNYSVRHWPPAAHANRTVVTVCRATNTQAVCCTANMHARTHPHTNPTPARTLCQHTTKQQVDTALHKQKIPVCRPGAPSADPDWHCVTRKESSSAGKQAVRGQRLEQTRLGVETPTSLPAVWGPAASKPPPCRMERARQAQHVLVLVVWGAGCSAPLCACARKK